MYDVDDDDNDDDIIGQTNSKHKVVIVEDVNKEEETMMSLTTLNTINMGYLPRIQIIVTPVIKLKQIVRIVPTTLILTQI